MRAEGAIKSVMREDSWDFFISYASEDRQEVAEPLAEGLRQAGYRVWYDRSELKLGDSLRRKIDDGLNRSRYGIVILSPHFLAKYYTNRELDGLIQREIAGNAQIIPIWYKLSDAEVRSYSAPLADRIAARWEDGLKSVLTRIIIVHLEGTRAHMLSEARMRLEEEKRKLGREMEDRLDEIMSSVDLPRLHNGHEVASIVVQTSELDIRNNEPADEDELALLLDFHRCLRVWQRDCKLDDIGERIKMEFDFSTQVRRLHEAGWSLFGGTRTHRKLPRLKTAVFAIVRQGSQSVSLRQGEEFFFWKFKPSQKQPE